MYPIPSTAHEKAGDTRPQAHHKGFTLVEILIVIVIIGILAGSLLMTMGTARDSAEAARIISEMRTMKSAAVLYKSDYGFWPRWDNANHYTDPQTNVDLLNYADKLPQNDNYWIGVMSMYGEAPAFVVLDASRLRTGVKKVLASKAVEMGFMGKLHPGPNLSGELHVFTSDDNYLVWVLAGY
jgi:general secretion pathway protein G